LRPEWILDKFGDVVNVCFLNVVITR
jgi:hypothetical protein